MRTILFLICLLAGSGLQAQNASIARGTPIGGQIRPASGYSRIIDVPYSIDTLHYYHHRVLMQRYKAGELEFVRSKSIEENMAARQLTQLQEKLDRMNYYAMQKMKISTFDAVRGQMRDIRDTRAHVDLSLYEKELLFYTDYDAGTVTTKQEPTIPEPDPKEEKRKQEERLRKERQAADEQQKAMLAREIMLAEELKRHGIDSVRAARKEARESRKE